MLKQFTKQQKKKAGGKIKDKYQDRKLKQLVNKAYSENKGEAALARYKLKHGDEMHQYVWDIMDISHPDFKVTRKVDTSGIGWGGAGW